MSITAEFRHDYAAALRNMHLNESDIARHTEGLMSTEGLPPDLLAEAHFEKIISERNTRVSAKVRATARRLVCGVGMIAPVAAVLAGAFLFIVVL